MPTPAPTQTILSERVVAHRRFAILQFVPPEGTLTTWSTPALKQLAEAVRSVDTSRVDAVVLYGTGRVFGAGADLQEFRTSTRWQDGEAIATAGYDAFDAISRLAVPTVAVIQGPALGGALELALRADYRVAAASVRALGLPEVNLGLIPGWGGLTSLARLLGLHRVGQIAVTQSLTGRHLTATRALEEGIVDAVLDEEDLLEAALRWTTEILNGTRCVADPAPHVDAARLTTTEACGNGPAAAAVSRLLDRWQERQPPLAPPPGDRTAARLAGGEDPIRTDTIAAFADLLQTDESRASIYAFDVVQAARRAHRATGNLTVTTVGVVGGGLMATQLALVFAERLTASVLLTDLDQERVDHALERVDAQLERSVRRGRLTAQRRDEIRGRIRGTVRLEDFTTCEVVIEAVFEQLKVKRQVWASLEGTVSSNTLLLTNTSGLSITDQATNLHHPERLIGFHFFNPVAVLPLVEIVQGRNTSATTVETSFALAQALGKTAVLVQDRPGFVVNRLLTRLFSDVLALIDGGADAVAVDTALQQDGLPMTPLTLLGYIGPTVQLHILEHLHNAYPERFHLSRSLQGLVEAGLPSYLDADGRLTSQAAALIHEARATSAAPVADREGPELRLALLQGLADEAHRILAEGTVRTPADLDACMLLGANFPTRAGGLLPLLDRAGASAHVRPEPFLPPDIASVPQRAEDQRVHADPTM